MTKPVTPQEMFDMWQKMVNPSAYPLQSLMFPVLDAKEIEKKIAELETVEHWLKANVNMLQLTVKSLRYQLAMIKGGEKALETFQKKGAKEDREGNAPDPATWAWNLMAKATRPAASSGEDETAPKKRPSGRKKSR